MTALEIQKENNRRLEILFRQKNDWLMASSYNITKDREAAEELVAELYSYVAERGNPNIWWGEDEYNMMYLYSFLKTRWINQIKQRDRNLPLSNNWDTVDEEYNEELDSRMQKSYDEIVNEINELQRTKMWSSARLAELYFFTPEMTLDKLSKDIGISKSTSFLNIKKIKQHIRLTKDNPFRKDS
jgi:DNA-directed RNA polymerase specialized sigma24 family protein